MFNPLKAKDLKNQVANRNNQDQMPPGIKGDGKRHTKQTRMKLSESNVINSQGK